MTSSKNTKRALLTSVLSMILCIAMLIGSTFAWFTDSVASAGNIIKSGNLDVALEWADGTKSLSDSATEWKDASTGAIFNYALWEPGYTEARHVRISNMGSLALKYEIRIAANGEVSKLADVIDVYYIKDGKQITNRTELTDENKIGTLAEVLANPYAAKGHILAGENAADIATIALKMQETAGNEYQGLAIGSDFSVQLVATQYTSESDSFDNQYDKYATYSDVITVKDVTEFKNAINGAEDGDVVALTDDMALTDSLTINKDITIVGNGNTISGKSVTAQADVTFKNVKLSKPESTKKNASLVYAYNGCEELVFDGCTFSDPQWEAMQITSNDLKTLTVTNCTFTAANVDGAANSGYGNTADQAIRFIHIQPSNSPVVNIKIANNKFLNCDKIADGVVGIYYVSEDSTITVGGNTFEGLEIENGNSGQLSVGWPEVEALKTVSYWTGEEMTFVIDHEASNPGVNKKI